MTDEQAPTHDFNPKHRVVGAIILVCVAVVALPLILSDRAVAPSTQPVAEVPTPNTRVVVTPITPVPLPSNAPPATVKTIPSLVTPTAPAPSSSAPSANSAVASNPTPSRNGASAPVTPTSVPVVASSEPAVTKGWIVQVGAFSDVDNANRLKENLVRHGYAPELDKIALNKTQVVRVRVGPYGSEAEARTALSRIQRELKVKGVVRAYP